MKYISKDSLLRVYDTLSTNTDSPTTQGSTQKISAIRHLFALYRFCNENKKQECDLTIRKDKEEFVKNVCSIVHLDDNYYTANFHTNVSELDDCRVSSNFLSAGVVSKSRINPSVVMGYPSSHPLFDVQNERIKCNKNYLDNIGFYLTSKKVRLAFALWLLRKTSIETSDIRRSIQERLTAIYSNELINALLPTDDFYDELSKSLKCDFSDKPCDITKEDLKPLFN